MNTKHLALSLTVAMACLATPLVAPVQAVEATTKTKPQDAPNYAPDRLLIKLQAGADKQAVVSRHQGKLLQQVGDWLVVETNKQQGDARTWKDKFAADAAVEAVELDALHQMLMTPNDPSYASQWHLPKIQAPQAWDITTGDPSRVLAIVDTGVDLNNAELSGRIVGGYDFVNNDAVAMDDQGHGTFAATVAAATGNNGVGGAGVDWTCKIMPVKVLSATGSGTTSAIISGIRYAADNGADVINLSLGGGSASTAFQDAINYAWSKGAIIVASVGGSNTTAYSYPAAYNNVVSVASTTSTDVRSSFSSYGTWVDLAAPGSSIYSTKLGGGMTTMSGTSWSAAIVSGVMTLAWAKNPAYSNTTVLNRVLNTADRITGTGTEWYYGRVNAYRAVNGF